MTNVCVIFDKFNSWINAVYQHKNTVVRTWINVLKWDVSLSSECTPQNTWYLLAVREFSENKTSTTLTIFVVMLAILVVAVIFTSATLKNLCNVTYCNRRCCDLISYSVRHSENSTLIILCWLNSSMWLTTDVGKLTKWWQVMIMSALQVLQQCTEYICFYLLTSLFTVHFLHCYNLEMLPLSARRDQLATHFLFLIILIFFS